MKVTNETKVGALTAIAITLLILGFNFLKGKSFFKTGYFLTAKFENTQGIMVSNAVYVNGFQIGNVYEIENVDANISKLLVTIKLKQAFNIPDNSVAMIKPSALGAASMVITLGDSKKYLESGAELKTMESPGLFGSITEKIEPISTQLLETLHTVDVMLKNINSVFDIATKNNLQQTLANINKATAGLAVSTASLQEMLNAQSGSINHSMKNVEAFTKNLSDNNDKITQTMSHIESTTKQLEQSDLKGTVAALQASINSLNNMLQKMNSTNGSLGLLMNDKALYNNLTNTIKSTNILIDDLRVHPKRYVNISVFGKKDKTGPLLKPLNDSLTVEKAIRN